MTVNFTVAGGGTTQWNPDNGYMKSSVVTSVIDGTMTGPASVRIHGTIRTVTESERIR